METGDISRKIERGRHTTRHSELFYVEENTYMMDTPGFSSMFIDCLEPGELKDYFRSLGLMRKNANFWGASMWESVSAV